ncbi:MAG: DsrE family protein [Dermatophilaceae bacterium]
MPHYRVIFQVVEPDPKLHEAALRNVRNTAADLGADAEVVLVAHGPGIGLVTGETGFQDEIEELAKEGVQVLACRNTLTRLQIPEDRFLPRVEIVTSGIGELVRRQHEGWAYVRP